MQLHCCPQGSSACAEGMLCVGSLYVSGCAQNTPAKSTVRTWHLSHLLGLAGAKHAVDGFPVECEARDSAVVWGIWVQVVIAFGHMKCCCPRQTEGCILHCVLTDPGKGAELSCGCKGYGVVQRHAFHDMAYILLVHKTLGPREKAGCRISSGHKPGSLTMATVLSYNSNAFG